MRNLECSENVELRLPAETPTCELHTCKFSREVTGDPWERRENKETAQLTSMGEVTVTRQLINQRSLLYSTRVGFSNIVGMCGMCKNVSFLVSYFQAFIQELNWRWSNAHKPDRKTVLTREYTDQATKWPNGHDQANWLGRFFCGQPRPKWPMNNPDKMIISSWNWKDIMLN